MFTTFLTTEEREQHDETHKNQLNNDYSQNQNNPIQLVNDVEYSESGFQEKSTNFVKPDSSNNITKCYVYCKHFNSKETKFVQLQNHLELFVSKRATGFVKAKTFGKNVLNLIIVRKSLLKIIQFYAPSTNTYS